MEVMTVGGDWLVGTCCTYALTVNKATNRIKEHARLKNWAQRDIMN